jgi:hypothetical protein
VKVPIQERRQVLYAYRPIWKVRGFAQFLALAAEGSFHSEDKPHSHSLPQRTRRLFCHRQAQGHGHAESPCLKRDVGNVRIRRSSSAAGV